MGGDSEIITGQDQQVRRGGAQDAVLLPFSRGCLDGVGNEGQPPLCAQATDEISVLHDRNGPIAAEIGENSLSREYALIAQGGAGKAGTKRSGPPDQTVGGPVARKPQIECAAGIGRVLQSLGY